MIKNQLNVTLIQSDIFWEDKDRNLTLYDDLIYRLYEKKEVIVLPEMFNTGFTMNTNLSETMDGPTVQWMKNTSIENNCVLIGSLIIEENQNFYNRLLCHFPDGRIYHYDKRHLFAFAGEDSHFKSGEQRLIVEVNGFRLCLMICYDLRFPVWSRNVNEEYDVLIYISNWPEKRSLAWKTLLQARAIENQSYVFGVNRVGQDGRGLNYSGDSSVFDPMGQKIYQLSFQQDIQTITLYKEVINNTRTSLPFLKDADKFEIGRK